MVKMEAAVEDAQLQLALLGESGKWSCRISSVA